MTPEQTKIRRLKAGIWALVATGLLYISGSVLVLNHLVQENNTFCAQRQVARSTIRTLFETKTPAWSLEDQKFLDEGLAEIVSC